MLQIKNIRKEYRTGGLVQKALDGVSLNFRDSEFAAILGPSGSGKTTLLNVLGGLDRYDSGDLIINGTSTKKYTDRDWDSYRNHTIGFVFQSYNLIPHQTILSNVELALTISGIGKEERRNKAAEALAKVGLGDQLHKKPGQLSGGQMQRVAIARALVNDPDILLADEPTGALDSVTSVQIMDILKEVAEDHLVIMVTHNPELAPGVRRPDCGAEGREYHFGLPAFFREQRGSGKSGAPEPGQSGHEFCHRFAAELQQPEDQESPHHSGGLCGIHRHHRHCHGFYPCPMGVNNYIRGVEEDTIREYPLTVDSSGFDMSAMFTRGGDGDAGKSAKKGRFGNCRR